MTDLFPSVQQFLRGQVPLSDVVQALEEGANPNQWKGPQTPLKCAIQAHEVSLLSTLLRGKADPNEKDAKGVTPLHVAVFEGKAREVQALLDGRADVNSVDRHGQTALFFAPSRHMCEVLIARDADVNITNNKNQSALHLAAHAGLNDSIACLASLARPDVLEAKDKNGNTAVYYAAHAKVKSAVSVLQAKGADVSIKSTRDKKRLAKSLSKVPSPLSAVESPASANPGAEEAAKSIACAVVESPQVPPATDGASAVSDVSALQEDSGEAETTAVQARGEAIAAERAEADRATAEMAAAERIVAEEKAAAEKAGADRVAAEKAAEAAAEKAAAEKAAAERSVAEQAALEEKGAADRAATEKAATEKEAIEQATAAEAAAKAVAKKAAAERTAAEKAAAEKTAVEKATAERIAAEKAAEAAEAEKIVKAAADAAAADAAAERRAAEDAAAEKAALAERAAAEKAAADAAAQEAGARKIGREDTSADAAPVAVEETSAMGETDMKPVASPDAAAGAAATRRAAELAAPQPVASVEDNGAPPEMAKDAQPQELPPPPVPDSVVECYDEPVMETCVAPDDATVCRRPQLASDEKSLDSSVADHEQDAEDAEERPPSRTVPQVDIYGGLFWETVLHKESLDDKYGFVQANGRLEFKQRMAISSTNPSSASARNEAPSQPEDTSIPGPDVLVVRRVNQGGLLEAWNKRHPEAEVKPQDRIVSVNGATTVEDMLTEIREPRIHIKLCRYPERFTVNLSKADNVRLGFRFERPTSQHLQELRISEVLKEGALPDHNAQQGALGHWHYAVLPDMRIQMANGIKGDAWAMAEELKRCETVSIQIRRAEAVLLTQQQVRARLNFLASFRNQQQQMLKQQQQQKDLDTEQEGNDEDGREPGLGSAEARGYPPEQQQASKWGAAAAAAAAEAPADDSRGPLGMMTGDRFAAAAMLMAADASVNRGD